MGSLKRGSRGIYGDIWGVYKGSRTQITGFEGRNTIHISIFEP